MRRVWRFILAMSVTPLMTAACFAILGWMTWNVAFEDRIGASSWHVGKIVDWLQQNTLRYPTGWPAGVFRRGEPPRVVVVIEDGNALRKVDRDSIHDPNATVVIVTTDAEPIARYGVFAITSEWWRTTARVIQRGADVVSPELSASIAEKMRHDRGLRMYANTVQAWRGRVPTVRWGGYMYNAIAVVVAALCVYSLQWVWRGARMPWGTNRAWRTAANSPPPKWWIRRVALMSPLTTLLLAAALFTVFSVVWNPRWSWQYRLQLALHRVTFPIDMWNYQYHKVPQTRIQHGDFISPIMDAPWLVLHEQEQWGSRGIRIPGGELPKGRLIAQMTTDTRPAVMINDVKATATDLEARRAHVERTMIDRGVISPEQAPLLWTAQPKRIVWQGVLFNGTMLIVACAFLASLLWLRDGVVWPWNARRLRKGACLKCGYSLSGLNTATCPECGTATQSPA